MWTDAPSDGERDDLDARFGAGPPSAETRSDGSRTDVQTAPSPLVVTGLPSPRRPARFRPGPTCRSKRATMALRLSQPATAGSTSTVPAFQALPTRARPLLATGDLAGYRALFAEAAAEPDLHKRYGARRDLLQAGLTVSRGSARVLAHTFLAVATAGLSLTLCMIVRDEESMLPRCLEAVKDAVDEIVVVDTGSTDGTVAIAESFGAKVLHHEWSGDFAAARNVSFDAATSDWIVYL